MSGRSIRPQSCQLCRADVAAAADDRHVLAGEPLRSGQHRRQRGRAGGLDEVARLLDHQPGRGLQRILRESLDDFVLVTEDLLRDATRLMIEKTRNLVEPAGAAALAAVLTDPGRFASREVALICSGGNISPAQLLSLWPSATP